MNSKLNTRARTMFIQAMKLNNNSPDCPPMVDDDATFNAFLAGMLATMDIMSKILEQFARRGRSRRGINNGYNRTL